MVVGDLENQAEHAGLRLVEVEHSAKEQRPHVHRCAHRQAGCGVHIPELHRAAGEIGLIFKEPNLSRTFGLPPPALAIPERSPFASAMNTATPMSENRCASACIVIVLPVPVAPVISPWRLASAGEGAHFSFFARSMRKIISTMAGHSRWANVKHRKERADAKRGKIFTRLIREITVAARLGGGDPGGNPRLRLALEKRASRTFPATTSSARSSAARASSRARRYEEVRYEGYGPAGAAVMLDCLTDNRTRTVAEVRHAFKNGGNLGSDGSVAYLFKHCGQFVFAPARARTR